ncbi:MAG: M23 family metallopeptidase [Deltaproteobacteria bacterium]|nr:MAG: M23 family metallopeptidase [Deltaproteobacteria bacterium]
MDPVRDPKAALEALLIRTLLETSGAFEGGGGAGAPVRSGLFLEALSGALAEAGGLGLAPLLDPTAAAPEAGHRPPEGDPIPGVPERVTSSFGMRRDPLTGEARFHAGVDLAAPEGAPIAALRGGRVRFAGRRGGYGQMVEIDHGDGTTTRYAHASELLVKTGDWVEEGQLVARVGHSGRATGPHLHLEVRRAGRPVDPRQALNRYAARADTADGGGLR